MNITETKKIFPILLRHKIVPFFWGQQGVGKTQVIKQMTKNMGDDYQFVHLHLATQEVGDLVGLLDKNAANNGTVRHLRPEWFPVSGKGVLFLDEANRAAPDVIQSMYSLITEGTIHTHRLPPGWSVIAAGNYQTNMFNVTDTSDSAWMSRFCHIDFQPSREEFVVHAEERGAFSVADFIRTNPELLETVHKERLNMSMITPDRRSWLEMVAKLDEETGIDDIRYEVYSGIMGTTSAAAYLTFKKKQQERLSGREVLNNYDGVRRKVRNASQSDSARFDVLNTAVEEIFTMLPDMELDDKSINNFKSFILDVPLEMALKINKKLNESSWKQKNKIINDLQFVEVFKDQKLKNGKT